MTRFDRKSWSAGELPDGLLGFFIQYRPSEAAVYRSKKELPHHSFPVGAYDCEGVNGFTISACCNMSDIENHFTCKQSLHG